jgi:lysozyme family protein
MSDFRRAFDLTLGHEGGYSNDPTDRGGETFMGITRRDHPDWRGWDLVAKLRRSAGPEHQRLLAELRDAAAAVYRARYWARFDGDSIPSQALAEELFDTGVNMGVGRAVRFLQEALNLLNRNGSSWADIVEDGDMGARTREALGACLARNDEKHLLRVMNVLQGAFYLALAKRDPSQEKYIRGWFARVFGTAA